MKERRVEERFEVCFDARWDGSTANCNCRIADLSESGCYIDTMAEAQVGQRISLNVMKPDQQWLALNGEVAHHKQRVGFGVRFVDLTEEQITQIRILLGKAEVNECEATDTPSGPLAEIDLTHREAM